MKDESVSVPSFGDSFFIALIPSLSVTFMHEFPSPHSGILFLFAGSLKPSLKMATCFRPLIRGFFFYKEIKNDSIS